MTKAYRSSTGLLTSSTDQSGNVTSVTWDSERRVAAVTTPLGTTTLTYCGCAATKRGENTGLLLMMAA